MRVLALTRYSPQGASSRVRTYQFLPYLEAHGVDVTVLPLLDTAYLDALYSRAPRWRRVTSAVAGYGSRCAALLALKEYHLVWAEKELLPWIPSWMEDVFRSRRIPLVLDYDDATFHRYDQSAMRRALFGGKIANLMRRASLVIAGNDYLAEYARRYGAQRVEQLPSVIDLQHYRAAEVRPGSPFTIGWVGTPVTASQLRVALPGLAEVCRQGGARVVLVGAASGAKLDGIPVHVKAWSPASETKEIAAFDVGIMPLEDGPFTCGKCGYKLIQYMGCALPVIASPVGVNRSIVEHGVNGFLASGRDEWRETLLTLKRDPGLRASMGQAGRRKVEQRFSLDVVAPRLLELLRSAAARQGRNSR